MESEVLLRLDMHNADLNAFSSRFWPDELWEIIAANVNENITV